MRQTEEKFSQLIAEVQACRLCARMDTSVRIFGPASGSLSAKVMFIGEAPGRLGADESAIPFHGDKSGHNFESLIEQVDLHRYEIFVTNAVLCNPKDEHGNNATPTPVEIKNCTSFLRRQLELIDPPIVVTLGATALKACGQLEEHSLALKDNVRKSTSWFGRELIPAYHPGQRAMLHRSFANQLADYQFISEKVRRLKRKSKSISAGKIKRTTQELVHEITSRENDLSYFALHKLVFMAEAKALDELGHRLTDSYIIRQKDGPYCVDLHPKKLANLGLNLTTYFKGERLFVKRKIDLFSPGKTNQSFFSSLEIAVIEAVMQKYSHLSDTEIKRAAYTTRAMREMLRKEKKLGLNVFNAPLLVPSIYE